MKHLTTLILIIFFLSSCLTNDKNKKGISQNSQQLKNERINDTVLKTTLWADKFIINYLNHNSEKLTEIDGYPITYIKDIDERDGRDGRKYTIARIGHSFKHRYVTNQLIFIDSLTKKTYEYDPLNDSLTLWSKYSQLDSNKNGIPTNGTYIFDIAFTESQGKSMGANITVIIKEDSAKVIYEGHGSLTAEIGEVIDKGILMKHKSGKWIIGTIESDKNLEEVGGCTGGPAIIDFKNKKYWMC